MIIVIKYDIPFTIESLSDGLHEMPHRHFGIDPFVTAIGNFRFLDRIVFTQHCINICIGKVIGVALRLIKEIHNVAGGFLRFAGIIQLHVSGTLWRGN